MRETADVISILGMVVGNMKEVVEIVRKNGGAETDMFGKAAEAYELLRRRWEGILGVGDVGRGRDGEGMMVGGLEDGMGVGMGLELDDISGWEEGWFSELFVTCS